MGSLDSGYIFVVLHFLHSHFRRKFGFIHVPRSARKKPASLSLKRNWIQTADAATKKRMLTIDKWSRTSENLVKQEASEKQRRESLRDLNPAARLSIVPRLKIDGLDGKWRSGGKDALHRARVTTLKWTNMSHRLRDQANLEAERESATKRRGEAVQRFRKLVRKVIMLQRFARAPNEGETQSARTRSKAEIQRIFRSTMRKVVMMQRAAKLMGGGKEIPALKVVATSEKESFGGSTLKSRLSFKDLVKKIIRMQRAAKQWNAIQRGVGMTPKSSLEGGKEVPSKSHGPSQAKSKFQNLVKKVINVQRITKVSGVARGQSGPEAHSTSKASKSERHRKFREAMRKVVHTHRAAQLLSEGLENSRRGLRPPGKPQRSEVEAPVGFMARKVSSREELRLYHACCRVPILLLSAPAVPARTQTPAFVLRNITIIWLRTTA